MKGTKKLLTISIFSAVALCAMPDAGSNATQDPPPQNPTSPTGSASQAAPGGPPRMGVFGKITAIHDQSIELAGPDGETLTIKITGDTRFRKEREAAKLSDFKVGDLVGVRGEQNEDHTWTAQTILSRSGAGFAAGPGRGEGRRAGGGRDFLMSGVLGQDYIFGEIKAVDAPKLTIFRPDNVTQTIELTEDTSLRKGRDSITMADIQTGDHVFVRGGMKNNVFEPRFVNVISPEQWKRMQEMGMAGPPPANPPKENNPQQKPPEPPR
jgi:preprotein translocase subunit YajC